MMLITPKNWLDFQHYKNRRPPWIKLYRTLLDDVEFHCLPDASKALAIMLWLLASEHESGSINADNKALAFRLRTTPQKIATSLKPLIDGGFFIASTTLATRLQDAIPETETETETETEGASAPAISKKKMNGEHVNLPDWLPVDHWNSFLAMRTRLRKPATPRAQHMLISKLQEMVERGHSAAQILAQSELKCWTDLYEPKGQ